MVANRGSLWHYSFRLPDSVRLSDSARLLTVAAARRAERRWGTRGARGRFRVRPAQPQWCERSTVAASRPNRVRLETAA